MAQIPNQNALTVSDGLNVYLNVDTVNKIVQILNGAVLKLYSDGGSTQVGQVNNALQSATAPAIANAATIATANISVSRVSPASAVTGIILALGNFPGQNCWVLNEATALNSVTFNVSGTSNVADGTSAVIWGGQARHFVWDSVTALWYSNPQTVGGSVPPPVQSATAVATGAADTIATAGLGVSRVSPAAARTGIILQAGTYPGQIVVVVNEATAANSLTFNTAPATANVADSATQAAIAGLSARAFVWDSVTALWYQLKGA